jgi:hypothetical protein
MGNGHELVQGRPPNCGVKREVNLRDVELDIFCTEVLFHPKCNWECYAPEGIYGLRAHPREWTRGPQPRPRNLQLSECCMADDIEAGPSVDQHVMWPHVGDNRGSHERQHAGPRHIVGTVGCPKGDGGAPPLLVWSGFGDPWDRRKNFPAQGLDTPAGDELPASVVHYIQLFASVVIIAGVRISGENVQPRSCPSAAAAFPSAPFWLGRWWGGESSLKDYSRRSLTHLASLIISRQSAARWRLLGCTRHVSPLRPWGRGRLLRSPWLPAVAATTETANCGFSWPWFLFLLFFLPLPWVTISELPTLLTSACSTECQARPSVALAHLSARAKRVVTLSTSCVANFSSIFSSRTPWRKAVMMEASEIRGIVPRTLVKQEMNARRVSLGSYLTVWRCASTPCRW